MRHRLVGGLRLAAGLRAASLLAAGHCQTAGAEAVHGDGGRVAAGEGVLEVAHVCFVWSATRAFFFCGMGFGVSWSVRGGDVGCCCWRENVLKRCAGDRYIYICSALEDNAELLGLPDKGKTRHVDQYNERA